MYTCVMCMYVYIYIYIFGSINETYEEAKKQLNNITIEDTNKWFLSPVAGGAATGVVKYNKNNNPRKGSMRATLCMYVHICIYIYMCIKIAVL